MCSIPKCIFDENFAFHAAAGGCVYDLAVSISVITAVKWHTQRKITNSYYLLKQN
jgi:hypothetical protein